MRPRRRRHDGEVPPAREPGDLRRARPHGAAVLAALPARRPAGELRQRRRVSRSRRALHRVPPVRDGDGAAPRHRGRHDRLRAELRRHGAAAVGPPGPVPEPPRQRLVRHRGRDGDEHAAAQPRRGRRRDRRLDRRSVGGRRPAEPAPERPGLPDRRHHPGPRGHPRGLSLRPGPDPRPGARARRGAPRRQVGDHRDRAALRREEGRRRRRDLQDRRARPRRRDHRDPEPVGGEGPLGQVRHADPDRAQARRDPAGRPQQALQAHGAADDVRLQRRRARRRRPAHAVAARARPPLPRPPARGRHAAPQVRAAQRGAPRARPRRPPDRAGQPRRGDRDDPRLVVDRRGARVADREVLPLGDPGAGDPRHAPAGADGSRAQAALRRLRRPPGADRRAPRDPRRREADRRRHPRGARSSSRSASARTTTGAPRSPPARGRSSSRT